MKKIYLFLLTLCLVSVWSLPVAAGDDLAFVEKDGIHYTVKGKNQVYIINSFHYWRSSDITDQNYAWLDGRDVEIPKSVRVDITVPYIHAHQNIIGVERYAFENMTAKVNLTLPTTIKISTHTLSKMQQDSKVLPFRRASNLLVNMPSMGAPN